MPRFHNINNVRVQFTAEEEAARDAEETLEASKQLDYALAAVRRERDRLIAETDYLALSDQTMSSNMTTYRQSLRDITNGLDTVEKCNNVTWPTKP